MRYCYKQMLIQRHENCYYLYNLLFGERDAIKFSEKLLKAVGSKLVQEVNEEWRDRQRMA